jgi:hypothetical protein
MLDQRVDAASSSVPAPVRQVRSSNAPTLAKPCGYRVPTSSTLCFAKRCMAVLPPGLALELGPVLRTYLHVDDPP